MAEVQLELKILIYPENGSWIAHCLEMDLPASGTNPNDALKNLMDSVLATTSVQSDNLAANAHLGNLTYPVVNPIKKVRHMATKLTSTVKTFTTPIRRLPKRLLPNRAATSNPPCGHCGKEAVQSSANTNPLFSRRPKTNPFTTSLNQKEIVMNNHDQDLSGDDVKYVEYSILSIKRDDEKIISEPVNTMVTGDMNGETFTAKVIKDNAAQLDSYELKDLRVHYRVLARYARPEQEYDKEQAASLKTIAEAAKKWGESQNATG